MRKNNFEIAHIDHNHEEVIVNRQKRHGFWKLKVASLLLAFLLWLASTAISQRNQSKNDQEPQQPTQEQAV